MNPQRSTNRSNKLFYTNNVKTKSLLFKQKDLRMLRIQGYEIRKISVPIETGNYYHYYYIKMIRKIIQRQFD